MYIIWRVEKARFNAYVLLDYDKIIIKAVRMTIDYESVKTR